MAFECNAFEIFKKKRRAYIYVRQVKWNDFEYLRQRNFSAFCSLFIFYQSQFALTTAFQHNYMLEFPICSILIWNEASADARVVIHDNLAGGIKVCIIEDMHWERGSYSEVTRIHFHSINMQGHNE